MEGTASAVQNPGGTLTRTLTRSLRRIDRSLVDEADDIEYLTQDFWVYFGRHRAQPALGREYFKDLFENGLNTLDADLWFALQSQTLLGLEYWAWVKNQAFEKTFDYDGRLLNACHIQTDLIG